VTTHEQCARISWNESFSVGEETLDRHHQHLAKLINQLSGHESGNLHSEQTVEILSALVNYAEYHFRLEEELMAEIAYEALDSHRQEHVNFCEVIAEICYGATLGVISEKELFNYLTRWWRNHILLEDMKYKPYLDRMPHNLAQRAS
jgi:hemerythrin-like metal-binding protein